MVDKEHVSILVDLRRALFNGEGELRKRELLASSKVDIALSLLHQKILDDKKSDMVALTVLFPFRHGKNHLDMPGIHTIVALEPATLASMRTFVQTLVAVIESKDDESVSKSKDHQEVSDLWDGIVVAADLLIPKKKTSRKIDRRVYVLSDAWDDLLISRSDDQKLVYAKEVVKKLVGEDMSVFLVANSERDDGNDDRKDGMESPLGDVAAILSDLEAKRLLSTAQKRFRNAALFKGHLRLCVDPDDAACLAIPVKLYTKSQAVPLPRFSKPYTLRTATKDSEYARSYGYFYEALGEDEDLTSVPREQLIKAYRYGKSLVPIALLDAELLEDPGKDGETNKGNEKGIEIIGFGKASQFRPWQSPRHTQFLALDADEATGSDRLRLRALVAAMQERGVVAVARSLLRGQLRLLALIPRASLHPPLGFFAMVLPFVEDVRRYTFGSAYGKCRSLLTSGQRSAMAAFVRANTFSSHDTSHDTTNTNEPAPYKQCHNPVSVRLLQTVRACAIRTCTMGGGVWEDREGTPALPVHVAQHFQSTIRDEQGALAACFPTRLVERWQPEHTRAQHVLPRFWAVAKDKDDAPRPQGEHDGSLLDKFWRMMDDRSQDRVAEAMVALMSAIPRLVLKTDGDAAREEERREAFEALRALRKGAIREDEHVRFNAYLREIQRRRRDHPQLASFWDCICRDKLTLISAEECPGALVTTEDAAAFLSPNDPDD